MSAAPCGDFGVAACGVTGGADGFDVVQQGGLIVFQLDEDASLRLSGGLDGFLRNHHLDGVPLRLMQNVSQRLRAPLEIAEDTLPVAFFVVRRAGIGIRHTVS